MEMGRIIALGLVGTIFSVLLKKESPIISILIAVSTGILIFFIAVEPLSSLILLLNESAKKAGVGNEHFSIILKIIGIAYLSQFGAQICNDAGEGAIAAKIELGGKILIMSTSAPILMSLLEMIVNLV